MHAQWPGWVLSLGVSCLDGGDGKSISAPPARRSENSALILFVHPQNGTLSPTPLLTSLESTNARIVCVFSHHLTICCVSGV